LRQHRADIERPYKMLLYPLPSVIAFAGWTYVFSTAGLVFILYGLLTLGLGAVAYLMWNRSLKMEG
jgi:hypothetical protein